MVKSKSANEANILNGCFPKRKEVDTAVPLKTNWVLDYKICAGILGSATLQSESFLGIEFETI